MTTAFVGLGSNQDEPVRQVQTALAELDQLPHTRLVRRSSLYRSAPLGHADQPDFINAVAQLETGSSAQRLLCDLLELEQRHGRRRSVPNAPRTLDLDLLLFGAAAFSGEALTLPHPRMHERAFVLEPLLEIAPDAEVPGHGAARELLRACRGQAVERMG